MFQAVEALQLGEAGSSVFGVFQSTMKHDNKSAFLCIFQAKIGGQLCQTEVPTKINPLNSRQVRRDCEAVARASFAGLAKKIGYAFRGSDPIKCVEIVEVKNPEAGTE